MLFHRRTHSIWVPLYGALLILFQADASTGTELPNPTRFLSVHLSEQCVGNLNSARRGLDLALSGNGMAGFEDPVYFQETPEAAAFLQQLTSGPNPQTLADPCFQEGLLLSTRYLNELAETLAANGSPDALNLWDLSHREAENLCRLAQANRDTTCRGKIHDRFFLLAHQMVSEHQKNQKNQENQAIASIIEESSDNLLVPFSMATALDRDCVLTAECNLTASAGVAGDSNVPLHAFMMAAYSEGYSKNCAGLIHSDSVNEIARSEGTPTASNQTSDSTPVVTALIINTDMNSEVQVGN